MSTEQRLTCLFLINGMKSVVHANKFHSDKCGLNHGPPSLCLNRGDHVTVSLCPLRELCPAPVHISPPQAE